MASVEEDDEAYIETAQKLIEISGHPWSDDQIDAAFNVLIDFSRRMQLVHLMRLRMEHPDEGER